MPKLNPRLEHFRRSPIMLEVPKEFWAKDYGDDLARVWLSESFLAQLYLEFGSRRLSINRTGLQRIRPDGSPLWQDGISWDDLQRIKNECGFADLWAVEAFPPQDDVINVANMRHLWLLPKPPPYGWRRS